MPGPRLLFLKFSQYLEEEDLNMLKILRGRTSILVIFVVMNIPQIMILIFQNFQINF